MVPTHCGAVRSVSCGTLVKDYTWSLVPEYEKCATRRCGTCGQSPTSAPGVPSPPTTALETPAHLEGKTALLVEKRQNQWPLRYYGYLGLAPHALQGRGDCGIHVVNRLDPHASHYVVRQF